MSREREREKQTERERETHTHTHTHIQTDRGRQTGLIWRLPLDLNIKTSSSCTGNITHLRDRSRSRQTDRQRQTDTQRQRHKRVCVTIAFKHQQLIICTGIMHLRETDGQTQRWR